MLEDPKFARASIRGALLAINLLFLMIWGFAGLGKLFTGIPSYFPEKFGPTFLAHFPGLTGTFWILTLSEVLAFSLAALSLVTGDAGFMERRFIVLGIALAWAGGGVAGEFGPDSTGL